MQAKQYLASTHAKVRVVFRYSPQMCFLQPSKQPNRLTARQKIILLQLQSVTSESEKPILLGRPRNIYQLKCHLKSYNCNCDGLFQQQKAISKPMLQQSCSFLLFAPRSLFPLRFNKDLCSDHQRQLVLEISSNHQLQASFKQTIMKI